MSDFNLEPHPRILQMLGEINLAQWRCVAELIDNSVDAFLDAKRKGAAVARPEVLVQIPLNNDAQSKITIKDNALGMDAQTLENAVKAGWTSNDPINNLGMFGMGFNIATARLGTVTRVWTTRPGDTEWTGLEIDFDALVAQRHFRTPRLTRPKLDSSECGTEISITRLKPEQREWFAKAANRSQVKSQLSVSYSAMLRSNGAPISFHLKFNGAPVEGKNHCIWGGDGNSERVVQTARYGKVSAFQSIDRALEGRPFCVKCWQWLRAAEVVCPACESETNVTMRERRVSGWLGIQRYCHGRDYGIDFIRHGRKIEIANKDLFQWVFEDTVEDEYPIDDPRRWGRIVGEVHLDHCRVTYTKDRFDRNDPAWSDMTRIIRGDGPIRPDKAGDLGYGPNSSPLFSLYQVFRRSTPKPKVAGCYQKLLMVPDNDLSEEMAKKFYAGEAEFQTDQKWWDLVLEADKQLLVPVMAGTSVPGGVRDSGGGVIEGFGASSSGSSSGPAQATPALPQPVRQQIQSLSREYIDDSSRQRWDIRAYAVEANDPALADDKPWAMKGRPEGIFEFFVELAHPAFNSATMTPLDALLSELAYSAMDILKANRDPSVSFAKVLGGLREKYAGVHKLDPASLSNAANLALNDMARSLADNVKSEGNVYFDGLTPTEQESVRQRMATRGVKNVDKIISECRFMEYAPRKTLLRFFETNPELFFDGKFWDDPFQSVEYGSEAANTEARTQLTRFYLSLLSDATWLADREPEDLRNVSRSRLLRAALALELLSPSKGE